MKDKIFNEFKFGGEVVWKDDWSHEEDHHVRVLGFKPHGESKTRPVYFTVDRDHRPALYCLRTGAQIAGAGM